MFAPNNSLVLFCSYACPSGGRAVPLRAPGFIVSASLVDFNNNAAAAFVALSGNGRIQVAFANNGTIAAGRAHTRPTVTLPRLLLPLPHSHRHSSSSSGGRSCRRSFLITGTAAVDDSTVVALPPRSAARRPNLILRVLDSCSA